MSLENDAASVELTDAELIAAVRNNDSAAYATLFERHRTAALRLARQLTSPDAADDLVSEGFTRVYAQLLDGKGPDEAFRAYLLSSIRRLHVDQIRRNTRERPVEDENLEQPVPFFDSAELGFERTATSLAFTSLPERWQLVLWHLEVEGEKPADVAPLLGMSANSVSALAYRAREGLRQAYLQQHIAATEDAKCEATTARLGAYTRGGLSARQQAAVKKHLDECRSCMGLYLEISEFNTGLGAILAPIVLGTAALGYLGTKGAAGATIALAGPRSQQLSGNASAGSSAGIVAGIAGVAAAAFVAVGALAVTNFSAPAVADPVQNVVAEPDTDTSTRGPAPSTAVPTTDQPTPSDTPTPSESPTTSSPTTSSPSRVSPAPGPASSPPTTTAPPPPYDASLSGVSFTNLSSSLTRRMTVTMAQSGAASTPHTLTVTFSFNRAITLYGSGGGLSCSAPSSYSIRCTGTFSADGSMSAWLDVYGVYPEGTASLSAAGDTNSSNNSVSFRAAAWSAP